MRKEANERKKKVKGKGREKSRLVKDTTENVKGWKEVKEDREELENKAKEITKPNSKTNERKKGRKNIKKERKTRNRNRRTLSWITKTKIGGSREIRSNVERGKREIGKKK